jgi:hypothetical protein
VREQLGMSALGMSRASTLIRLTRRTPSPWLTCILAHTTHIQLRT